MQTKKQQLRRRLKERRKNLSQTYTDAADRVIEDLVTGSEIFRNARSVFVYISTPQEPDTSWILQAAFSAGKNVSVPRCYGRGKMKAVRVTAESVYRINSYGIPEPVVDCEVNTPEEVDLVIVPCLSVNDEGVRLGHGMGYYDRWLADTDAATMCLCYERMKEADIPQDEHDVRMQYVVSEAGIHSNSECKRPA
jgi:5-formyltetrahydrofolate cyclo-ligase